MSASTAVLLGACLALAAGLLASAADVASVHEELAVCRAQQTIEDDGGACEMDGAGGQGGQEP